jgi:hypothetical protein
MSNPILYINNYAIPYEDVDTWPALVEEINFDSSINVPDTREYVLDNSSPGKYDPKYYGSLLYGTKIFGLPVAVYEPDIGCYTSRGVIKNVSTDSSSNKISITVQSQLSALSNVDCQYVNASITPAQAMYNMMTAPITIGSSQKLIDPSYLDYSSFNFASTAQASNKCYVDIGVYKDGDNSKKYSDIFPELLKVAHCFMYSHYDKIYLWQYTGNNKIDYTISDIVAGSYKDSYSLDDAFKLRNSYNIAYFSGSSVVFKAGKDMSSIQKYGESIFGIPSDDVNSSNSSDFNVGINNITGATWCGNLALQRYKKPSLLCNFSVDYGYSFLKIGDVLGLNFYSFSNIPVLILSASYQRKEKIDLKCLFL